MIFYDYYFLGKLSILKSILGFLFPVNYERVLCALWWEIMGKKIVMCIMEAALENNKSGEMFF